MHTCEIKKFAHFTFMSLLMIFIYVETPIMLMLLLEEFCGRPMGRCGQLDACGHHAGDLALNSKD